MRTVAWWITLGYPHLKVKTETLPILSSVREVHEGTVGGFRTKPAQSLQKGSA